MRDEVRARALLYRASNEQGCTMKLSGDFNRIIAELDGFQFIAAQNARWQEWRVEESTRQLKMLELRRATIY